MQRTASGGGIGAFGDAILALHMTGELGIHINEFAYSVSWASRNAYICAPHISAHIVDLAPSCAYRAGNIALCLWCCASVVAFSPIGFAVAFTTLSTGFEWDAPSWYAIDDSTCL